VIGIYEQDDVALSNLLAKRGSILGAGRRVDNGCGDIVRIPDAGRNSDLWKDGLNLVGDELIFDEGRNEAGLASALIAADADSDYWDNIPGVSMEVTTRRGTSAV
jgi:hypothetical protein